MRQACSNTTSPTSKVDHGDAGDSHAGLDMRAGFKRDADDKAARRGGHRHPALEQSACPWPGHALVADDPRAALLAGTPWLEVFCHGCGTSKAIDLRTIDRHRWPQ
jgi:hypothetical protein